MILPSRINTGNHRLNDYLERMRRTVQSNVLNSGPTAFISRNQMGTVVSVPISRAIAASAAASLALSPIWLFYQKKDADLTVPEWWRTINVGAGLVNNIHPTGDGDSDYSDDNDPDNADIVLDASATTKIWLDCTISTDLDGLEGSVLDVTIGVGASLPSQPVGDLTTGAPPDHWFILLGAVKTSADPSYTSGDYPAGTLTIPSPQPVQNSLWVSEESYGSIQAGDGYCFTYKRMAVRSI